MHAVGMDHECSRCGDVLGACGSEDGTCWYGGDLGRYCTPCKAGVLEREYNRHNEGVLDEYDLS